MMARTRRRPVKAALRSGLSSSIDTMQPGDLLYRLAMLSPQDYRAVIQIARERYRTLWPLDSDPLEVLLERTGTHH